MSHSRIPEPEASFDEVVSPNWIIREKIAEALRIDGDLDSLKILRFLGPQWPETVFRQWKKISGFSEISFIENRGLNQIQRFMNRSSPRWIPISLEVDVEDLLKPTVIQFIQEFSYLFVSFSLMHFGPNALDFENKLNVFDGHSIRNLRKLVISISDDMDATTTIEEYQAALTAIDHLFSRRRAPELEVFKIDLGLSWRHIRPTLTLPPAITNVSVSTNCIGMLADETNELPNLKSLELGDEYIDALELGLDDAIREPEVAARRIQNILQRHGRKLEEIICWDILFETLHGVDLPLSLADLPSLRKIQLHLPNCRVQVENSEGANFLRNLREASIWCTFKHEDEPVEAIVARLNSLGMAIRHVPSASLDLMDFFVTPVPHLEGIWPTFSFVTKFTWCGRENILPHVFRNMKALEELDFDLSFLEIETDLSEILAGHRLDEIPEEEELWEGVLNQRTDVITNLPRLKSLTVRLRSLRPLTRFLFRAAFSKMANLSKIIIRYRSTQEWTRAFFCSQVVEDINNWEQDNRQLLFEHDQDEFEGEEDVEEQ